jgi:FtsP/CotA-like multicopper oxidase with cupredoxin domain
MLRKRLIGAMLLLGVTASVGSRCFAYDASLPRIATHDNRTPAGILENGVLTLNLEIREGDWYPEAENGPHVAVYAFGEAGKAPTIPGPLVRVPEGTEIRITVKNTLPRPMEVHGLFTRPVKNVPIVLAAGEEREVRFPAGAPGTYYYFAFDPQQTVTKFRIPRDQSQLLSGALIVDGPGSAPSDGVFVIALWHHFTNDDAAFDHEFGVINGKSWPYTERQSFALGETVHWRWINASPGTHPMHLHGAYYRIDALGDGAQDTRFAPDQQPMVVTENLRAGATMDMTWKPDRPGHWLFHCHIAAHIDPESSLSAIQNPKAMHHAPGGSGMAGLVLAADVEGGQKFKPPSYRPARQLTLTLTQSAALKPIEVEIADGRTSARSIALSGPPVILHRGEATEITIINRMPEPTAIHWHGMELESQYDGVPDFSGVGKQITPPIAPGKSFIARMTPPRAGTFIYHTHWHDVDQLTAGLYGPLIVLEPGQQFRPEQDVPLVAGLTVKDTDGPLLINGLEHSEITVRAGRVRLRLINITPNNTALLYTLTAAGKKLQWRTVAKDGMDLPPAQQKSCEAAQNVGVGETYDFEITAAAGDELHLEGFLPGPKLKTVATIRVQ